IGELAAAPILEAVDLAVATLDQRLVALDHGRHLLALVRMDQEHDFVMTHCGFLVDTGQLAGQPPVGRDGRGGARPPPEWQGAGNYRRFKGLRATGAGWLQAARSASVVKDSPQPHSAATLGLAKTNCSFSPDLRKSIRVPSTRARLSAST